MDRTTENIRIDYQYQPTPDAERRLARALDIVLQLILAEFNQTQTAPPYVPTPDEPE